MIITDHQWELSHDFRGVDVVVFDRCQSLVLTMCDLEARCSRLWSNDG